MDGGAGRLPIKWALTTHLVMWQVPRCLKEYEVQKIRYNSHETSASRARSQFQARGSGTADLYFPRVPR